VIEICFQSTYNVLEIITFKALRRLFLELKKDYDVIQARHVLKRIKGQLLELQSDGMIAMEEAIALKNSMTNSCSMLAVAVSQPPIHAICLLDISYDSVLIISIDYRLLLPRK
jgi:hypothetical protein